MSDDQQRWALGDGVVGDYEKYDKIKQNILAMPEKMAEGMANYTEISEEEYDYICEVLDDIATLPGRPPTEVCFGSCQPNCEPQFKPYCVHRTSEL